MGVLEIGGGLSGRDRGVGRLRGDARRDGRAATPARRRAAALAPTATATACHQDGSQQTRHGATAQGGQTLDVLVHCHALK